MLTSSQFSSFSMCDEACIKGHDGSSTPSYTMVRMHSTTWHLEDILWVSSSVKPPKTLQDSGAIQSSELFHHPPIPGTADHQIRRFNVICTCYRGQRAAEALRHCNENVWARAPVWESLRKDRVYEGMRLVLSAQARGGPSSEPSSQAQALTAAG